MGAQPELIQAETWPGWRKKQLTSRYNGFAVDEGTRTLISKGQTKPSELDLGIPATLFFFSTGDSFVAMYFSSTYLKHVRYIHTCLTRHPLNHVVHSN